MLSNGVSIHCFGPSRLAHLASRVCNQGGDDRNAAFKDPRILNNQMYHLYTKQAFLYGISLKAVTALRLISFAYTGGKVVHNTSTRRTSSVCTYGNHDVSVVVKAPLAPTGAT